MDLRDRRQVVETFPRALCSRPARRISQTAEWLGGKPSVKVILKTPLANSPGLLALSVSLLSGCAGSQELVVTEPVGPIKTEVQRSGAAGQLIVYSAWDRLGTLDSEHPKHTAYTIYSGQGTTRKRVGNRGGSFEGDPQVVDLAPGRYWIEAEATNVGPIKVPAVIREGRTTMVYLDGTTRPSGAGQGTNWITEPNGLIIGRKDTGQPIPLARAMEVGPSN